MTTQQVTLYGGPFDGLQVFVEIGKLEVAVPYLGGDLEAIYQARVGDSGIIWRYAGTVDPNR